MTEDRDEFDPAPEPVAASTLPSGLRTRVWALSLDLRSLAAALARHVRQEEARFDRRRQRRRERSGARRESRSGS
jgi:hypothetical protein